MLLYVTVMLKPLLPIAGDWWSHEFNEIEHISEVHAIYGSHHLQKEVADTSTENDNSRNQSTVKSEDQFPFHILPEVDRHYITVNESDNYYNVFKTGKIAFVFILNQGPPPKFSW